MPKIITAYITRTGVPTPGLSPTIKIWEISATTDSVIVTDDMIEVGDGIYKYIFTTYDNRTNYGFIVTAGAGIPQNQQYHVAFNESYVEDIAFETWEEDQLDHLTAGTTGFEQALNSETLAIVTEILKYDRNRTFVNPINKTLTIYEDDGTTPFKIFDLYDDSGVRSIIDIFERVPQ